MKKQRFKIDTPADLLMAVDYATGTGLIKLSHDEALRHAKDYAKLINDDRDNGCSDDPQAEVFGRDWLTDCLEQLSKAELVDVVLEVLNQLRMITEIHNECIGSKDKWDSTVELAEVICGTLNTRYLNRHPDEW